MKAAVLHELGTLPKYDDFNAPTPQNDNELLITIKAASIKQLDRMKAAGRPGTEGQAASGRRRSCKRPA